MTWWLHDIMWLVVLQLFKMSSKPCTFAELIQHHQLTEEDCSKQVSRQHLVLFSHSHCGQWRQLPAFLELETAVAEGIYHGPGDDESKRYSFLLKWKQIRGPKATYKELLITALIANMNSQDADKVCRVLKESPTAPPSPPPQQPTSIPAHSTSRKQLHDQSPSQLGRTWEGYPLCKHNEVYVLFSSNTYT